MPALVVTRSVASISSKREDSSTMRDRSAISYANFPSVAGNKSTNSSPPIRPTKSFPRTAARRIAPNWRSTASPAACPDESDRIAFLILNAAARKAFKRAAVQGFRERVQIPFENEPVDHV
ncbi:conserved hypothetical protein [Ricinus communis]|uniref:Uncharacterized protein n=1 Tax=Ricinus communis TaxID=3988 RepID=B9T7G8_RICCO|nr:conserved hypothetical protein [Ricinus communis]